MKAFIIRNSWLTKNESGLANGYVAIPKGNRLYRRSYEVIHDMIPNLSVHGGLTFSAHLSEIPTDILKKNNISISGDYWVVGFDTLHLNDTPEFWTEQAVQAETDKLKRELERWLKQVEEDTQPKRLLRYLETYECIDPLTAWKELGIYRLSASVFILRQEGVNIETERKTVLNKFGEKCVVANYVLLRTLDE